MSIVLTIAEGAGRGRRFRFEAQEVTIGRAPGSNLLLAEPGVSRSHARIRADGPGHVLLDDGSTNGTELNGARVGEAAPLRAGDRIGVGPFVFEFARRDESALHHAARVALRIAARFGGGLQDALDGVRKGCRARSVAWRTCIAVAIASCSMTVASISLRARHAAQPGAAAPSRVANRQTAPPSQAGSGAFASPGDVHAAQEWYERGRHKLQERRVAPRNLYDAWSSFTTARRLLQGVRPAPPLDTLEALIEAAQRDLEGDCSRLLFAARRFERYGQDDRAQALYREVLLHFPGDDPSGCRARARGNLESDLEGGAG